jgi:ribose 5-phosphate isomerase A
VPWNKDGQLLRTDNGNFVLDCEVGPIADPACLENELRDIPGVVGTGLFLKMADVVLIGRGQNYEFVEERRRKP